MGLFRDKKRFLLQKKSRRTLFGTFQGQNTVFTTEKVPEDSVWDFWAQNTNSMHRNVTNLDESGIPPFSATNMLDRDAVPP